MKILFLLFAITFSVFSYSADISIGPNNNIIFTGVIVKGDAKQLETVVTEELDYTKPTSMVLNSRGGLEREGILIAELVSYYYINTVVEDVCASACAYIFFSGRNSFIIADGAVGLHRGVRIEIEDGKEILGPESEPNSRAWYSAFGSLVNATQDVNMAVKILNTIYDTPNKEIFWINKDNVTEFGGLYRTER